MQIHFDAIQNGAEITVVLRSRGFAETIVLRDNLLATRLEGSPPQLTFKYDGDIEVSKNRIDVVIIATDGTRQVGHWSIVFDQDKMLEDAESLIGQMGPIYGSVFSMVRRMML